MSLWRKEPILKRLPNNCKKNLSKSVLKREPSKKKTKSISNKSNNIPKRYKSSRKRWRTWRLWFPVPSATSSEVLPINELAIKEWKTLILINTHRFYKEKKLSVFVCDSWRKRGLTNLERGRESSLFSENNIRREVKINKLPSLDLCIISIRDSSRFSLSRFDQ